MQSILCVEAPHTYRLKINNKQKLVENRCDRKLEQSFRTTSMKKVFIDKIIERKAWF